MAVKNTPRANVFRVLWGRLKVHPLSKLGPGLITGVADDDPSGIATYSQAGAQFGLNMLWTMPLAFPMMAAVQSMCANLGRVTGKGLAANIKVAFSPIVLQSVVLLLLIANTLNIAADLAAMGSGGTGQRRQPTPDDRDLRVRDAGATAVRPVPPIRLPSQVADAVAARLRSRTVYGAYPVGAGGLTHGLANIHAKRYCRRGGFVALFGTTISPYLFFWQTSEEVEDMQIKPRDESLKQDPRKAKKELRRIRWDTWSGMLYSNITAYFIILATAVTLNVAGVTDINTAAQAASALRPLAGEFAYLLFAFGILGVGLIGVPVLAGSGAYALSEAMGWHEGLERKVRDARGFYGIIAISVLVALAIQYSPISPMKALFWSAVINGVVAVPLVVVIILLVSKKSVMGDFTVSRPLAFLGWITAAVMGAAAVAMLIPG
jgi:Mn2+/Fe2+ NRAMP family transporter